MNRVGEFPFLSYPKLKIKVCEFVKRLIAVCSVVLVLVFSLALPSFADSVVNGFAVDDVPYSDSFEGVLTSSDTDSQIYSSSEHKTYKVNSATSSPSSSLTPLYTAKSVTKLIPTNIWRGSESPTVSFPVSNGYTGVKFVWANASNAHSVYHSLEMSPFTFFKSERKYRITFTLSLSKVKGKFDFYLASASDSSTPVIPLVSVNVPQSSGAYLSYSSRSYSFDIVAPNGVSALSPVVKCSIYGTDFSLYINNFTVYDITTEDLDQSLDKLGDKIDSSINPSVPYDKWDDGSFKDSAGKLKDAENNLPTVDFKAIEDLKNSIDISSYSHAFASINQLFIRLVDTVGVTPLIFFACFFGFCIFLIGRKLSGG